MILGAGVGAEFNSVILGPGVGAELNSVILGHGVSAELNSVILGPGVGAKLIKGYELSYATGSLNAGSSCIQWGV